MFTKSRFRRHLLLLSGSVPVLLLLLVTAARAQNAATDGFTPKGLEQGAPAGTYPLSGFESVNYFNGHLNFALSLIHLGGRGSAGYTVPLRIERKWLVIKTPSPIGPAGGWVHTPEPDDWQAVKPGYGLGVLIGRVIGQPGQNCGNATTTQTDTLTRLTFTAGDGTEYELRDTTALDGHASVTTWSNCDVGFTPNRGRVFVSGDGAGVTFISDADIFDAYNGGTVEQLRPSGYLLLPDGTRYRIDDGKVSWLRDRTGNRITFEYGWYGVRRITDSLNRQVIISYGDDPATPYNDHDEITFKGFGGAARTIKVWYGQMSTALRTGDSVQTFATLFPELNGASASTYFDYRVFTSVELPDGRRYNFRYNRYGELARLELPTGGAVEYDYAAGIVGGAASGSYGGSGQFIGKQVYRRVIERRVYRDGGTVYENRTLISRPEDSNLNNLGYVDVEQQSQGAPGATLSKDRHWYYGSAKVPTGQTPFDYSRWKDGKEWKSEAFDANGTTILRRGENTWQQPLNGSTWPLTTAETNDLARPNNPQITQTLSTLPDTGQVARQTFAWDKYLNRTDVYEYDYGAGAPPSWATRHTHTDFLTTNVIGGVTTSYADPANGSFYTASDYYLRNLPQKQIVYAVSPSGGAETRTAQTDYEYDNYTADSTHAALVGRAAITGLDGAYASTTTSLARGNVTAATRYRDAVALTGALTTYQQYDVAGNVVRTIDGRGNVTTLDYSDRFGSPDGEARANAGAAELAGLSTYAFPTKVTNALGHEAYTQFDYDLGRPVDTEDANGIRSSLYYNDALDRPTKGIRGVGTAAASQTVITYNDTNTTVGGAPPKSVLTISDRDSFGESSLPTPTGLKVVAMYDGLGRTFRRATYEGETGSGLTWAVTETQYDALSRAWRSCHPFRAAAPDAALPGSPEWTTSAFDALNRVLSVTTPDSAVVTTAYSGSQVLVTDQAGKQRLSQMSAPGWLTDVWEITAADTATEAVTFNGSALNGYRTKYQYDALNNLKTVTQQAGTSGTMQTRTFNYDSLSRLTSATNPESGTVTYQYDGNSNLQTKTDARNITTTYGYDALNRNTSVTHSPVTNGTADVYLYYDTATNGKGRFGYSVSYNARWDGDGRPYWHADVVTGYDALGRPTGKWQGFALFDGTGSVTAWQPYNLSRTYNLAGAVTSQTLPSGRTVSYSYDSAGRLQNFTGTLGDGVSRGYATGITYNSYGLTSRETYGTQTPLYLNLHYNNRQQLVDLRLGTNSGYEWDWSRGALVFYYGTNARNQWNPFADSPDNNGNVLRQVSYAPLSTGGSVIPQNDDYTYDALNRVTSVSEIQQNSSGVWSGNVFTQTFSYDRWGNRGIDVANTTPNVPGVTRRTLSFNPANNRLTAIDGVAVAYDSAGSQTTISASGQPDYELRDYDAENRMTRATKSGVTSYYHYDASGRRVRRIVGGVETWQVYGFEGELVAEYNVSGTFSGSNAPAQAAPVKEYGYRSGQMLVVFDSTEVAADDKLKWLVQDHLGSTRMIVNKSGSLTGMKRRDYLPFGEELAATVGHRAASGSGYAVDDKPRQKFVGYERDSETGLDFAGARYYANVQGRFTSPDIPFADQIEDEPQSWNLYSYVTNNPLKFSDPFGLWKRYKTGDDRVIYEAEPGDTFADLAEILQVPVAAIVNAFGTDKVVSGALYDVSDYKSWKTSLQKTIEDIQFYQEQRRFHNDPIDIDSPDPTSPWTSHYPGLGGIKPRTNPFSPNIMSKGRWVEIKEAARELANNVYKEAARSGVGAGARSGQHGKPYTKAASALRELLKKNENNWLPEFKEVIEKKIQEFISKAKTINEKI